MNEDVKMKLPENLDLKREKTGMNLGKYYLDFKFYKVVENR